MGEDVNIAYIRVSTIEQNLERQKEALSRYGIERWYEEKVSGKNTDREQLQEMLSFVREGDTVYVHDLSRLARSTKDLLELVDLFSKKNVKLVSVKENIDSNTPMGKLMLTMVGAIHEFERTNMLERQREGIAIAKKNGVYKGRKPIDIPSDFPEYYERWMHHEISKSEIAKKLHISRPTCNKLFALYEKKEAVYSYK